MSDTIIVTEEVTTIIEVSETEYLLETVPPEVQIITEGVQGPPGPPGEQGVEGPPGVDGTGDKTFSQSFTNVTSQVLVHNLSKFPSVVVRDSAGTEYEVEIIYDSLNQVTLNWNTLLTGTAVCN